MERQSVIDLRVSPRGTGTILEAQPSRETTAVRVLTADPEPAAPPARAPSAVVSWAWRAVVVVAVVLTLIGTLAWASTPPA